MCNHTLTDTAGKVLRTHGCGRCSACNTIQPRENFYADKTRSTGLSSRCKACDKKRLETIPARNLTADLKALMARHPAFRPVLESMANSLAA